MIVPTLIAALDALAIRAISDPASNMLDMFLAAIPNILAAALILLLAWFVGRFVSGLVTKLLANLGFDRLPARLGLGHVFEGGDAPAAGIPAVPEAAEARKRAMRHRRQPGAGRNRTRSPATSLSASPGRVALFFIMLFATVEAAHRLGFTGVRDLLRPSRVRRRGCWARRSW